MRPRLRGVAAMLRVSIVRPKMSDQTLSGSLYHSGSIKPRLKNPAIASGVLAKKRMRIAIHARCSAARGGITRADPQQHARLREDEGRMRVARREQ